MNWNVDVPKTEYYGPLPGEPFNSVDPHAVQALVNELKHTSEVALDTETTGLVLWKDIPRYWSIAWGTRRATLHAGILSWFHEVFADPSKRWVLANAKYDMHMLANNPGYPIILAGSVVDTQVMHSLLYEDKPHGLKFMCQHLLGWTWGDFQDQFGKINAKQSAGALLDKAEQDNFDLLVEYAGNDAWGTLGAYRALRNQLQAAQTHSLFRDKPPYIETLWDLFWKVEVPYTKSLWRMERHGVKVDRAKFAAALPQAEAHLNDLERTLYRMRGAPINLNSPPQLKKWLLDEMELRPVSFTKGGKGGSRSASTDAKFMEFHAEHGVEACKLILEHRKYSKLLNTYIRGLDSIVDPFDRIHARFNQDVARCMPAGELVLTNRGYIPVEKAKVGDEVFTHKQRWRPVVETSRHEKSPIILVQLASNHRLRTNAQHKYLVTENGKVATARWVEAQNLHRGLQCFVHVEDGGLVPSAINAVYSLSHEEEVYGLTVEEDHSHVTGGIVTHNTGRLSSSEPNLQNIPKLENDHWGLREAFIPESHCVHLCLDYSQLEMCLLAAASGERSMIDMIHAGKDIHMGNAEIVFKLPYDDIKAAKRKSKSALTEYDKRCLAARADVKSIGFGILYGMGVPRLAASLNISEREAQDKIDQFMRAYPAVEQFTEEAVEETRRTGYAFTVLGRRRNVAEIASDRRAVRRRGERLAVNTQIQGSAADVVKMAQIMFDKLRYEPDFGCRMVLQVHDELLFECPKEHASFMLKEVKSLMEHPFSQDLPVQLTAEGGIGLSWAEAKG